mmetsp:Transcript_14400/g.34855  ORF Transcript_14400/g.34855 Transcript_14400/m.34855 type:complete len:160 (+) Transcript_14400:15-494(+)
MVKASEKRAVQNLTIVRQHALAMVLATLLFAGYRLWRHAATASWLHWGSVVITTVVYGVCYKLLAAQASSGGELFQKGLVEYCWDMVWITLFVQVASCASDWFWLIYLIPPCVGAYYAWTLVIYPWISKPDNVPGEGDDAAASKKRAKMERQMRRAKGK